ncbi:MAG TPA: cation:proton antiporter [Terriglobales bacterium]|nr:cation:proton antiporter [Terriglobales bacterium]
MNTSLQILLCIAVVIVTAKLAATAASRLGLPLVLGELLAGVLLGPSLLNLWGLHWLAPVSSGSISVPSIFKILADIGVVLLMFVAGVETDLTMMRRTVGPAFWAATGGVILPMAGGYLLSKSFGFSTAEAVFIGTILTATSVTITAQALMNLNQLRSKVGSTILGAAVIDDVLGLIVLSVVIALAPQLSQNGAASWGSLAAILVRMSVCLLTMGLLGPWLTRWALKQATRLHGQHTEVAVALAIALLLAFEAQWFGGMAAITGSYLAGLFVAMTPHREKVSQDVHPMLNSFFGPVFFVSIGMEVNAWRLGGRLSFFLLLLAIAVLGKILGCGLGALSNGFSRRDSLTVGVGMIPRGEVGLITASLGWTAGLVTRDVYIQVVALVLLTTLITPGLLRYSFPKAALAKPAPAGARADLQAIPAGADLADA